MWDCEAWLAVSASSELGSQELGLSTWSASRGGWVVLAQKALTAASVTADEWPAPATYAMQASDKSPGLPGCWQYCGAVEGGEGNAQGRAFGEVD